MSFKIQNNGNVLSVPGKPFPYQHGVGRVLFDKMKEHKDSVAQIDGLTGEKDTFESVLRRSIRTAIKMRSKGISSEDIVTICSFNHLDTTIPIFASLFLGAKIASIDTALSLPDSVYLLNQVRPKMVFASPNGVKLVEDALQQLGLASEIVVFGETTKHTKFSEFLTESPEEEKFAPVDVLNLKKTVSIFFSSGTSGMPKGVCVSHLTVLHQIPKNREAETADGLGFLSYSTPYWISSFIFGVVNCTATRSYKLILPNFDVDTIWSMIEKFKIFFAFLSPSQLGTMLSHGRPDGVDVSCLKSILTGGAPFSKEQLHALKNLLPGTIVNIRYGQTELCNSGLSFCHTSDPEDLRLFSERPTSCGRPQPEFAFKIVDPDTEEILGPNQRGELRIKTEYQMNGYYNQDSSSAWDAEGFLKTGDLAYYDEDYCFHIVDRIKEMLKFQSWQIAPAKLEAILLAHPAIESAVVIGLPHPIDGDHPLAIVVLNKSGIQVTPEEIAKYVDERVDDKQKLRGGVKIVEKIAVTPSGKFMRRHMKELVLQGKI